MSPSSDVYTFPITIPYGSLEPLQYRFHSNDTAGNWANSSQSNVTVYDNDGPTFGSDYTWAYCLTGDPIQFTIIARDNIKMDRMFLEYWFGDGAHQNVSMAGNVTYTYQLTVPPDSLDDLHYIFHCNDTSDNWNRTIEKIAYTEDDDKPNFGEELTPSMGTTGEVIEFRINVTDNIEVDSVRMVYEINSITYDPVSMVEGDTNEYSLKGPISIDGRKFLDYFSNALEEITYYFIANDTSGNQNTTNERIITVVDNDKPYFEGDHSGTSPTTGDPHVFAIVVKDNIDVDEVTVEYWFGEDEHQTKTLSIESYDHITSIIIPSDSLDPLHYLFIARDTSGNLNQTRTATLPVEDNDCPSLTLIVPSGDPTTGDVYQIRATSFDNIGVDRLLINYWFGYGGIISDLMDLDTEYYYDIPIPTDSIDTLNIRISSNDLADNYNSSEILTFELEDNDPPIFGEDRTPTSIYTGETILFSIEINDNIDTTRARVSYWYADESHVITDLSGNGPYTFSLPVAEDETRTIHYDFEAYDGNENIAYTQKKDILVLDGADPVFGVDQSDEGGFTGSSFTFKMWASDNIRVDLITVEYWFGDGEHVVELQTGKSFEMTIDIPMDSRLDLCYFFRAVDTSGREVITRTTNIVVRDNVKPSIIEDHTATEFKEGRNITFHIDAFDNIDILEIWVTYDFGSTATWGMEMLFVEGYSYTRSMLVRRPRNISYYFTIEDLYGNEFVSETRTVHVIPIIEEVEPEPEIKDKDEDVSYWIYMLIAIIIMMIAGAVFLFLFYRNKLDSNLENTYRIEIDNLRGKIGEIEKLGMNAIKERQLLAEKEELLEAFIGK
ncbi:MAG: hypothetical protein KAH57_10960, partial [Thermoplasmata archaeon]|nr:hypothetical protein [Thermoplasmata archaeon]